MLQRELVRVRSQQWRERLQIALPGHCHLAFVVAPAQTPPLALWAPRGLVGLARSHWAAGWRLVVGGLWLQRRPGRTGLVEAVVRDARILALVRAWVVLELVQQAGGVVGGVELALELVLLATQKQASPQRVHRTVPPQRAQRWQHDGWPAAKISPAAEYKIEKLSRLSKILRWACEADAFADCRPFWSCWGRRAPR